MEQRPSRSPGPSAQWAERGAPDRNGILPDAAGIPHKVWPGSDGREWAELRIAGAVAGQELSGVPGEEIFGTV